MTSVYKSFAGALLGHLCLLGLLFVQIRLPAKTIVSAPVLFDLKDLEIASETHVPAPKKSPVAVKKTVEAMPEIKTKSVQEDVLPTPVIPEKEAVTVKEKKPADVPVAKPKVKPKPPVITEPEKRKTPTTEKMKTLLASVEKISAQIGKEDAKGQTLGKQENVPKITVGELDFIASAIRKHWNLDAGVSGVDKMLIEVKVFLDASGGVYDVQFLDTSRYGKDAAYTSVADSARRAIFICDKLGDESPFKKLAQKHVGAYSEWKELVLRFTPFEGGR